MNGKKDTKPASKPKIIYRKIRKPSKKTTCLVVIGILLSLAIPSMAMGIIKDPDQIMDLPMDPEPDENPEIEPFNDWPDKVQPESPGISGHSSNSYHV